jgi:HTH-type transcriptional regulator, sugar sensing transcriptional regulator
MQNENLFKEIGLTKWESDSYVTLLKIGSTTTGPLVKRSGVPQSKIYSVLDSIIEKGLVTYIVKGKVKYFQATDPKRILTLFKEKEKQVEKLINSLPLPEPSSVEMFEGLKAMRIAWATTVENSKKEEEIYGYSQGIDYPEEVSEFWGWCHERSSIKKLKDYLLISKKNKEEFEQLIPKEELPKIKQYTKYSEVVFPGDVGIFRDQVLLYNWNYPYKLIVITDKALAKQYKDFFMDLWGKARS